VRQYRAQERLIEEVQEVLASPQQLLVADSAASEQRNGVLAPRRARAQIIPADSEYFRSILRGNLLR
jgi:hypothetical protein